MKTRIIFLFIFTSTILIMGCKSQKEESKLFCHHVYFWLNEPKNADARKEFEEGISYLLQIPEIQSSHFGIPAETTHRDVVDGSYTYSYLVFFKNKEDHDIYQKHPIHLEFIKKYGHLWNKVLVYDSENINK